MPPIEIVYYNIIFTTYPATETEAAACRLLSENLSTDSFAVHDVVQWCRHRGIRVEVRYRYEKGKPLRANIIGFFIYRDSVRELKKYEKKTHVLNKK